MAETTQTPSMPRSGVAAKEPEATVVHQAEGQVRQVVAETKELGSEAMAAVRDSATTFFEEQRDRAATEIAAVGNLLCSSVQLLDRNGGTVGNYARDAGKQINDFADRLRTRSWSGLCGDVEGFARDNPMVFLAAAVGAGFVAARVIAASANQPVGETPMQSSMALLKDTGDQLRDTLRSGPAGGTTSMSDRTTGSTTTGSTSLGGGSQTTTGSMSPGSSMSPGNSTIGSSSSTTGSSTGGTMAPKSPIGTTAGTNGGSGRR